MRGGMRNAEFRPDAGCRGGMRDSGSEMRLEWNPGAGNDEGRDSTEFTPFLVSPHLIPVPAFLFCTLHRVEIPHSASISGLTSCSRSQPHQIRARNASGLTIGSPSLHPHAALNSG